MGKSTKKKTTKRTTNRYTREKATQDVMNNTKTGKLLKSLQNRLYKMDGNYLETSRRRSDFFGVLITMLVVMFSVPMENDKAFYVLAFSGIAMAIVSLYLSVRRRNKGKSKAELHLKKAFSKTDIGYIFVIFIGLCVVFERIFNLTPINK